MVKVDAQGCDIPFDEGSVEARAHFLFSMKSTRMAKEETIEDFVGV